MSTRTIRLIASVVLLLTAASPAWADRVRLRSGKVVEGTFLAADSKTVRLLLANGTRGEYPIGDVAGVDFSARAAAPATPPPNPVAQPAPIKVPGGTVINVRLTQGIDVDASQAGMKFKSLVDDPVMINGKIVIPRGAAATLQAVQVQQSGTMKGSDKITLKMNTISFGGRVYEVATQVRRDEEQRGGEEDRAESRRRRRPWRGDRRNCRRRFWRGNWRGGWWRDGGHRLQCRRSTPAPAGRNASAVSAQFHRLDSTVTHPARCRSLGREGKAAANDGARAAARAPFPARRMLRCRHASQ